MIINQKRFSQIRRIQKYYHNKKRFSQMILNKKDSKGFSQIVTNENKCIQINS